MNSRMDPIPHAPLREQVLGTIRAAVVRGRFRPGEKVPETELADQLGVSRTPVREALRILEYQGLVETRPKAGTYIAQPAAAALRDGLLLRVCLEQFALRQAVLKHGPEGWLQVCDELDAIVTQMSSAAEDGDDVAATEADVRWHEVLVSAADSEQLLRAWYTAGSPTLVWSAEVAQYPLARGDWLATVDEHRQLVDVFRSSVQGDCLEAIEDHIMAKLHTQCASASGPAGFGSVGSSIGTTPRQRRRRA